MEITWPCIVPQCDWRVTIAPGDIGTPLAEDYRNHLPTHTIEELVGGIEIAAAGEVMGRFIAKSMWEGEPP